MISAFRSIDGSVSLRQIERFTTLTTIIPWEKISIVIPKSLPVADPGFSPGGCANSQKCYYFSFFPRKLHENERIWTPGGGARPWRPPLDPPMITYKFNSWNHVLCIGLIYLFLTFCWWLDVVNNRMTEQC